MPGAVDMSLNDVPAEPAVDRGSTFEVDAAAHADPTQAGTAQRLADHVSGERSFGQNLDDRQADTVHSDGIAMAGIGRDDGATDGEASGIAEVFLAADSPHFFDDSCEHAARLSQCGGHADGCHAANPLRCSHADAP